MIVLCLEGVHGSGKTGLCELFEKEGFVVMDEAFLDRPSEKLHPQSLVMETMWVCSWINRLLEAHRLAEERGLKDQIIVADRSPFSAIFYAHSGHLLESIVRQEMNELKESLGIHVVTVNVNVDKETLWSRIEERLRREPMRAKFGEDNKEWMEKITKKYSSISWDLSVDNSEDRSDLTPVLHSLLDSFISKYPKYSTALEGVSKKLYKAVVAMQARKSLVVEGPGSSGCKKSMKEIEESFKGLNVGKENMDDVNAQEVPQMTTEVFTCAGKRIGLQSLK